MTFESFEDIEAWRKARILANEIFVLTCQDAFSKDFDLKNQIRASSGSIMDNIAEGFERNGKAEFINFLSIAKGSAGEVRSQLYRALDRNYIDETKFNCLKSNVLEISKMISNLMSYLRKSDYKGTKYK